MHGTHTHFSICARHGKRRPISYLWEVQPGVYECRLNQVCRLGLSSYRAHDNGAPYSMISQDAFTRPHHAVERGLAQTPSANLRFYHTETDFCSSTESHKNIIEALPEPEKIPISNVDEENRVGAASTPTDLPCSVSGETVVSDPAGTQSSQVICLWHARKRYLTDCKPLPSRHASYVCKESSSCLVDGPVGEPESICRENEFQEVICSIHYHLRSVFFMKRTANGSGYVCRAFHRCQFQLNDRMLTSESISVPSTSQEQESFATTEGTYPPQDHSILDLPGDEYLNPYSFYFV